LIGLETNIININGTALQRRTLHEATWEIARWKLARVLTHDGTLFAKAPIAESIETKHDGKEFYVLPHGLVLPAELSISVTVAGKLVEKSLVNEHNALLIRDEVAEVFKPLVHKLGTELVKLDHLIGAEKKRDKKEALVHKGNELLSKFFEDAEKA